MDFNRNNNSSEIPKQNDFRIILQFDMGSYQDIIAI